MTILFILPELPWYFIVIVYIVKNRIIIIKKCLKKIKTGIPLICKNIGI